MIWGGIILIVVCVIIIILSTEETCRNAVWFPIALLITGVAMVAEGVRMESPTAIDVYRGKTTLEITYRDSVAVDSVVVYKMK